MGCGLVQDLILGWGLVQDGYADKDEYQQEDKNRVGWRAICHGVVCATTILVCGRLGRLQVWFGLVWI